MAIFKTLIGAASSTKMRPAAKVAKNPFGLRMAEQLAILGKHVSTVNVARRCHLTICSSRVGWASVERSGHGSITVEIRTAATICFDY
jgi:hypothetical protein